MSNNTNLNGTTVAGGATFRDIDKGGVKTQVVTLDLGGAGAESLIEGSIPVAFVAASDTWGQAISAVAGSTTTVVNIASSPANMRITGLIAHGTGDGYFVVQVNAVTVFSGRTRSTLPTLVITLPNGIAVTTGSVVALKVTNESGSTADYDATLLGT